MKGVIPPELIGCYLAVFVYILVFLRAFGSRELRRGARPIKVILSVAEFAFSVASGDIQETIQNFFLITVVATGYFGLYILLAWGFPENNRGRKDWGVIAMATLFLVGFVYISAAASYDFLQSGGFLTYLKQRANQD